MMNLLSGMPFETFILWCVGAGIGLLVVVEVAYAVYMNHLQDKEGYL